MSRDVPSWFLAPHEEKEVKKLLQERTNEECAEQFAVFAQCARNHQLLFSWKCADQKQQMLDCVAYWGSPKQFEKERARYIAEKQSKLEDTTKHTESGK